MRRRCAIERLRIGIIGLGIRANEVRAMLVNQLAHQLDMLLWLCGEPESLVSVLRNGRYRDILVENEIIASLSLAGGATAELIANGYDPFGLDRLELSFSKGKLILEGGARLRILRYSQDEAEWNRGLNFQAMSHIKSISREKLVKEEN